MKNIKFRGLTKDGKWIYGDLVHDDFDGTSKIIKVGIKKPNCYAEEVIPETVGQTIGTADNTGREIFSGDILTTSRGRIKVLYIDRHSAYLGVDVGDTWDDFLYTFDKEEFVVVGNVHEL